MIAEIAPITRLPISLPYLDYLIPEELHKTIAPGQIAIIPFRNKPAFGLVLNIREDTAVDTAKLKPIAEIISTQPFLPENLIGFNKEISEFYRASLGFVLKSALLPLQKRKIFKAGEALSALPEKSNPKRYKPSFIPYASEEELSNIVNKTLSAGGQKLILVPETYQIETLKMILPAEEAEKAVVVRGEMTEKEYFEAWMNVRNNPDILVIGTRKALWLPWTNLSSVIIEDEGNSSYKSWDMAPRYHAREAAVLLAKYTGAKIFLLSASPSLETYYFTKNKIYDGFTSLKKISNPSPIFCDPKLEKRGGNTMSLSAEIVDRLKNIQEHAFILAPRKGTAGTVLCRDCGYIYKCDNCGRTNAYFKKTNQINCHFCRTGKILPPNCPSCGGLNYYFAGAGTEGIADEIKKIAGPDTKVQVIDSENTETLSIKNENKLIIVGTDYAWPYLEWKKIETIVVADADTALLSAEYKSIEDFWQTIRRIQLHGRPGNSFFIQTSNAENPVFLGVYNPVDYYEAALKERKIFGYPPYNYIVRMYHGSTQKSSAENEATAAVKHLQNLTKTATDVKILGPIGAFPPYYRGQFWQVIIIKLNYKNYKQRSKELLSGFSEEWKIDPNPNNLISIA